MSLDKEKFDYEEELKINTNNLREECMEQPYLLMKYSEAQAGARRVLADAAEEVKVIRSQLIRDCLEKAVDEKLKKPTQSEIEADYRTSQLHKDAKTALIEAEEDVNLLTAAVSAFHTRKDMIVNIIRLLGMNYFAEVQVPGSVQEATANAGATNTREAVREKRRRKSKEE